MTDKKPIRIALVGHGKSKMMLTAALIALAERFPVAIVDGISENKRTGITEIIELKTREKPLEISCDTHHRPHRHHTKRGERW